jgi:uncharacterized membrane protein
MLILRAALILLTVGYPFVVYYGLTNWDISTFIVLLVVIALLRWLNPGNQMGPRWLWSGLLIVIAVSIWALESTEGLKVYPVLVNLSFLALFSHSLLHPPTIIERLARVSEPDLPEEGVIYTRRVTMIWVGFFIFNGSIAAITAVWASTEVWTLYNGLVAYLLIGGLFAGEWIVRGWVRRNHD